MPYNIVISGCVECAVVSLEAADQALTFYRALGHKPRLFYSMSFDHLGDEIDDAGKPLRQYTSMTATDFAEYLKRFRQVRYARDRDFDCPTVSAPLFNVFGTYKGRERFIAELHYQDGSEQPSDIRVHTHLLRVIQGLMALEDL